MKCAQHKNIDANGLCAHCLKAICDQCDDGQNYKRDCNRKSCREALDIEKIIIEKSYKNMNASQASLHGLPFFVLGLGVIFLITPFVLKMSILNLYMLPTGVAFVVYGLFVLLRSVLSSK